MAFTLGLTSGVKDHMPSKPRLPGLRGYSVERFSYLWFKLYVSIFAAFLLNSTGGSGKGFGLRQRAALALVLSKAVDKERCRAYLANSGDSVHIIHLAYQLFLLGQRARVRVDIVEGDLQIELDDGSQYKFKLIPVLDPQKAPFVHDLHPFIDIFIHGEYDFYDCKGGVVIDVGGYIGDTAVYFARRGARKVYAVEPNPINYKYLLANVQLNGLSDVVVGKNSAVSMERLSLKVPRDLGGGGSLYVGNAEDVTYDIENLKPTELLAQEASVSLLKLDCKGCEREIFKYSLNELSKKVSHIIVEVERLGQKQIKDIVATLNQNGFELDKIDDFYPTLYLSNRNLRPTEEK